MIYALIDNCIIVLLTVLSVFRSGYPNPLIVAAGLFLVIVTADSMGFRVGWIRWILCPCFGILSGNWFGFLVFGVLWPGGNRLAGEWEERALSKERNAFLRTSFWLPIPAAAAACFISGLIGGRKELTGQLIAEGFLFAMAALAGVTLILAGKYILLAGRARHFGERRLLQQSAVSEMREKKLNRQLAQQNYLADKNARLTERENISRNIHNSVGHTITAAIMTLDAADMLYDTRPEEARKRMNDANERIRGSLESIRRAVRTLDQDSADVPMKDLTAEMESIIDFFVMDTEIRVDRLFDPFPEGMQLPHEYLEFLTGVLQEFLTNGVKHGHADRFLVRLSGDSAHIRLTVKDNGESDFGPENEQQRIRQGFGLKKIISFAERCGGHAEFGREDGFRSMVELPLWSEDSERQGIR